MAAPNRVARHPSNAAANTCGVATAAALTATAYATLHRLGTTSGSTPEVADAPHALVLHSRTHLPPGWDESIGAALDSVWTFALDPAPTSGTRTRLLVRNRGRVQPTWLDLAYRAVTVPSDHVMTKGFFRGLDERLSA